MSVRAIAAVIAATSLVRSTAAQSPTSTEDVAREVGRLIDENGVVGGALYWMKDGQVVGSVHHGFADKDTGRLIDENTIYHWASITKTLTSISIMQLRDRGRLSLDDPIVDYLPELRGVHSPYGDMSEITIRHLLSHSSGFRAPTWPWGGDEEWHPHEPTEWSQLVAMIPYTEIRFEPGSRYGYSNPGLIFLGEVVEQLSGDDIEVYVDKNIFKPLGMHHSYFDGTPYHLLPHRSNNYMGTRDSLVTQGLDFDTGITAANGGWNAPIGDMVRYLNFLLGVNDTDDVYNTVLARSSLMEMWEPRYEVFTGSQTSERMGLSFFVRAEAGTRAIGHTGGQKGFTTFIYFLPEHRAACIGAVNTLMFTRDGDDLVDDYGAFSGMRSRCFADML